MINKWDERWLGEAKLRATYSKDPSTKVGAVIAKDKRHISFGYNGFPASCDDDSYLYDNKSYKYKLVVHAECNAIIKAGLDCKGGTIYTYPLAPCPACSNLLSAAGIVRVVSLIAPKQSSTKVYLDTEETEFILKMNHIDYEFINENN